MTSADLFPARFVQEREYRQSMDRTAWQNLVYVWRLIGPLEERRLREAQSALVRRHELLRSALREIDGEVVQVIAPAVGLPWASSDLSSTPPPEHEEALAGLIGDLLGKPFSLAAAPLFRTALARLGIEEHVLILVVPHIVWDAWSTGVFIRELLALHDGHQLPELPVQFADFASFERQSNSRDALTYWRERLAGYKRELDLPGLGSSRAALYQPGEHRFRAACSEVAGRVNLIAKAEHTTPAVVVLSAFVAILGAAARRQEITIAAADANRARDELRDVIGYLVTVNLIRVSLSHDPTVREIVGRTHHAVTEAYGHELPVENQAGDPRLVMDEPTPFSEAFFNFVPATVSAAGDVSSATLLAESCPTPSVWKKFPTRSTPWGAQVDCELWVRSSGAIDAVLSYNTNVFTNDRARDFADDFSRLLGMMVREPDSKYAALARRVTLAESGAQMV